MRYSLLIALSLMGCGRAHDFSTPAPARALECTLEYAGVAGYELVDGGVQSSEIRLVQSVPPTPAAEMPPLPQAPIRDQPDRPVQNQIVARYLNGRLTLSVLGIADSGATVRAGSDAEAQARTILAFCGTDGDGPPEP